MAKRKTDTIMQDLEKHINRLPRDKQITILKKVGLFSEEKRDLNMFEIWKDTKAELIEQWAHLERLSPEEINKIAEIIFPMHLPRLKEVEHLQKAKNFFISYFNAQTQSCEAILEQIYEIANEDPESQFFLWEYFFIEDNHDEAFYWLEMAAKNNHPRAQEKFSQYNTKIRTDQKGPRSDLKKTDTKSETIIDTDLIPSTTTTTIKCHWAFYLTRKAAHSNNLLSHIELNKQFLLFIVLGISPLDLLLQLNDALIHNKDLIHLILSIIPLEQGFIEHFPESQDDKHELITTLLKQLPPITKQNQDMIIVEIVYLLMTSCKAKITPFFASTAKQIIDKRDRYESLDRADTKNPTHEIIV